MLGCMMLQRLSLGARIAWSGFRKRFLCWGWVKHVQNHCKSVDSDKAYDARCLVAGGCASQRVINLHINARAQICSSSSR